MKRILPLLILALTVLIGVRAQAEDVKMLFLGNSITRHSPYPSIGWTNDWGMAATSADKDYVHVLAKMYGEKVGKTPVLRVRNIAAFEQGWSTYDLANDVDIAEDIAFAPDVIVIAIGENVADISNNGEAYLQKFRDLCSLYTDLVAGEKFVIRSPFWNNAAQDNVQKTVAEELKVVYVDGSDVDSDEHRAHDQGWTHSGIADHPGDSGMQAIAEQMFAALEAGKTADVVAAEKAAAEEEYNSWVEPENVTRVGEYATVDGIGNMTAISPCAGGNEVRKLSDGEYVHYFRSSGVLNAPEDHDITIQYLLVGGGGGGGSVMGGGGGGGAVVVGEYTIPAGESATITVGAGGERGNIGDGSRGTNGGDTSIHFSGAAGAHITALGGGAGASWSGPNFDQGVGMDGGSGGGGGGASTCGNHRPGHGLQGHSGGKCYLVDGTDGSIPGGGGGAGTPGGDATFNAETKTGQSGNGGDGVVCAITGSDSVYGTGGAGAYCVSYGGYSFTAGTAGSSGACNGNSGENGLPYTGGGGGGGGWDGSGSLQSGSGGCGVVIIRYVPYDGYDSGESRMRQYDDYVFLDYIQSTGKEHINTGIYAIDDVVVNGEITLLIDYVYREGNNQAAIVGGSWDSKGFFLMTFQSSLRYNVGDNYVDVGDTKGIWEYNKRMTFTIDHDSFSLNGCDDIFVSDAGNNHEEIAIFWVGNGWGLGHEPYAGIFRLHGLTMVNKETGALLRDFRPVKRISTGEYGLFDAVSGSFFGNASGAGAFLGGEMLMIEDDAEPAIEYATVLDTGIADASFNIAIAAPEGETCDIYAVYGHDGFINETRVAAGAVKGINKVTIDGLKPDSVNDVHFEIRDASGVISRYPANEVIRFSTKAEVWEYADYIRLDGIKSTGYEFINTEVPCASDLAYDIEFTPDETVEDQNDRPIFGSSWDGVGYFMYFSPNKDLLFLAANASIQIDRGEAWDFGQRLTVSATKGSFTLNGVTYPVGGSSVGTQSNIVLFFVGYNNYNLAMPRYGGRYTLHHFRIANSGGVLRDYYPAYKISTDEIGLLDVANDGRFYGNNTGSGGFIAIDPTYVLFDKEVNYINSHMTATFTRQCDDACEVYAVWGDIYGGDSIEAWANTVKVGEFAEGANEGTFTVRDFGSPKYLRFRTTAGEWSETIFLPETPHEVSGLSIILR